MDKQDLRALKDAEAALKHLAESGDLPLQTRSALDSCRRLVLDYIPEDTRPARRRRSRRTDLKLVTD